MALLYLESFDHYLTADVLTKWASQITGGAAGTVAITAAVGRKGTAAARFTVVAGGNSTGPNLQTKNFVTSGATAIMGAAFNVSSVVSAVRCGIFEIFDGATVQSSVKVNADGSFSVLRGDANLGTVLGTSNANVATGVYNYLEYKTLIDPAAGTYELRLNGQSILTGTGANTRASAASQWNHIGLGKSVSNTTGNAGTLDFDDLYVCDGSGASSNNFLGPITVVAKFPDAAGTTTQMTATPAVANYLNVDDPTYDADTTYVAETTVGELDLYNFAALALVGVVKGVQVNLVARSAASGGETIAPMYRISAVNYTGTAQAITTAYQAYREIRDTSPATAVAWTVAEIDGAEFGCKLVS